jgi:deoxyribodipyrimidine photolyase
MEKEIYDYIKPKIEECFNNIKKELKNYEYKEKGKILNQARKIQADLKVFREKQEEELIKSQQEYARIQREEYTKSVNKIRETIQKGKSENIVIAKNQKSNLEDFIFSPQEIKNDKGEVVGRVTKFKQVLNNYLSDPEKMVALAYKLYEGLSDKSDKIERASKEKSKLAESLKRASGKTKSDTIKLEFINRSSLKILYGVEIM